MAEFHLARSCFCAFGSLLRQHEIFIGFLMKMPRFTVLFNVFIIISLIFFCAARH